MKERGMRWRIKGKRKSSNINRLAAIRDYMCGVVNHYMGSIVCIVDNMRGIIDHDMGSIVSH
jgi:hypothetical protein